MGGDAAVREKQAFNKKYAKAETAREEVACGFVGKLLSDKKTLQDFCYAVEHKQVRSETVKWLINACKWCVGKFTNRPKKGEAALIDTVKNVFGTDIETATEAIKALQTAYQEATRSDVLKKNTTAESGVKHSIKRTKNMSWEEQINGALYDERNIRRNDTLVVAKAKDTYIENVVEKLPFAIPQSVMTKAMTGKDISHSIKRGKLSKLEDGIINATMVIVNPDRNAIVFVTNIKQGGLPIVVSFERNTEFDGDRAHKATSVHLQVDLHSMLKSLSKNADIFVKKNEPDPVGATDNLRGLAAKIKLVDIISNEITSVNPTEQETSKKDFKAVDAQYLAAVERGDMEVAQRMVDEAAKRAGYTIHAYHGTKSAEPVTYDDGGKVIPLSKRFNADDPDIRYDKKSPSDKAQSGEELLGTDEGKQAYAERYGMQLETEGQAQRAAARDVQRANEAKQKAQSAEVAKEAEALLEEKMQKAAEDKLEERRKKYFTPPKKQKAPDLSEMSREELQAGLVKAERNLRLERLKKETAQSQLKRTNGSKTDPTGVYILKIAGTVLLL